MSRSQITLVVLLQCAALLWVCRLIGDNGWDDGAITLAFARTFARHGRVALTPGSEVVEGFSSLSWFLLNSLIALCRPSFRGAIALSQALSVLSIAACTVLLARTCALLRLGRLFTALTVFAFAAWGCSFSEAADGMEMGLLGAACLLVINELLSPEPRLSLLCGGVVLAITTRFEAVLYVGLFALSVCFVPGRRLFRAIVFSSLCTVALLTVFRLAVFSDVLPNTYWAKRWPPYAALRFWDRWESGKELWPFFKRPFIAAGIAVAFNVSFGSGLAALRARRPALAILAAPILGAVVMGLLTGKHWGYPGRMPYFAVPPALLLLSLLFSGSMAAGGNRFQAVLAAGSAVLATASLLWAVNISGVGYPDLWLAVARNGTFSVTPHSYAHSGQVFRRFASAAELPHAVLLTSDVGGLALSCDEFRIVDLAFLSNRTLAHDGPGAIGRVLDAESPDLIEAHWEWPAVGRLYDLPSFRERYAPAFAGGTKLWIRRDVADGIARRARGCWVPQSRDDVKRALEDRHYVETELPDDRASFERPGVVFALDEPESNGVNLCRTAARDYGAGATGR